MPEMPWQARFGLAGAMLLLLAVALGLSYVNHDDSNRNIIVGAIIAGSTTVLGFYFGSSDSSRKKDDVIAKAGSTVTTEVDAKAGTATTKTEPQPA